MFPAVVVDLGSQVRPAEAAWVLAACNAAIVRGTCALEAPADTPPRAVAIVRLQGRRERVRIEVGLRESERGAWTVREIEFSAKDPVRERWRTVGLALATLVGEVEAARADAADAPPASSTGDQAPAAGEAVPAPLSEQAGAEPAQATAGQPTVAQPTAEQPAAQPAPPAEPAPSPEPEPALPEPLEPAPVTRRRVIVSESDEEPEPVAPFPRHHGVFVGIGVLASPAATGGTTPLGAALRGGYSLPSGWVLALNADYARAEFEPDDYALDALRFMPGIGYRLSPGEHWSIGLAAYAGVRALWASSARAGGVQQNAWSPLVAGSLELWWQALPVAGLWAALELGTIGRATRVRGLDSTLDAVVPAAEARGFFGLWLAL